MKRFVSIILSLTLIVIVLTLTGCEKNDTDSQKQDGNTTNQNVEKQEHKHVWVEANCIAPKHCEECGQTIGEAAGHSWVEATCTAPKTCSKCGKTEGKELCHSWKEATCTAPETCSLCGETSGEALDHDVSVEVCDEVTSCRRCGEKIPALGHDWIEATCTNPKTCARCGETEGDSLGHEWKAATCSRAKTCERCGITEGEPLDHFWIEATCKTPRKCKKCGKIDGEKLGHAFENGKCTRCGEKDPNYVPPETFEDNKYYEIVDEVKLTNSIGYTVLVKKVEARANVQVTATLVAYDTKGNVIGKSTDDIILTLGETNFFRFVFQENISKARIETSYKVSDDSWMVGPRNAVEMVKYNRSGDYLYITFRQKNESLGSFAKFKILLYKGSKIVGTEWSYFSVSAQNLAGKDTTDIAEIWVWGDNFDRIEYIFEP